jgi:hypothetical protein
LKRRQKRFLQRQAPGAIEAAAERRVDDELHAARGVEEALDDDPLLRRQRAEDGERAREVVDDLARRLVVEADVGAQRGDRRLAAVARRCARRPRAQRATASDSSSLRPGASPSQNGMLGARAVRVLDADAAGLDAQDAVARVAELEDVAGDALDREVLVDGADVGALRLEDDGVVAALGDRPARGERGQPRALPLAQDVVDDVAVDVARARAVARREAVGEHAHDGVEVGARELRVRPGAAHEREQSSSFHSRLAVSATICWARTSSGAGTMRSASSSPRRTASSSAAHSTSSSRDCGKRRAFGTPPTAWPSGRRAAGRSRSSAASRAGRPGRRRRCRGRARATRSRPAPSVRRASGAARRRAALPWRGCRGARRPPPCRAARRGGARRARPCAGC